MFDPMPHAYAACADECDRILKSEERYELRVEHAQIETIHRWQDMPDKERADDMRNASDYRDFDERLWAYVMKRYRAQDPECIQLVHDMARCSAELTTDFNED